MHFALVCVQLFLSSVFSTAEEFDHKWVGLTSTSSGKLRCNCCARLSSGASDALGLLAGCMCEHADPDVASTRWLGPLVLIFINVAEK